MSKRHRDPDDRWGTIHAVVDLERVVVLGCGYAGAAIARLARERGLRVLAHVRSEVRAAALGTEGFDVLRVATLNAAAFARMGPIDARTLVVVAFPPDGATDACIAPLLAGAASVVYISSTGVYGELRGVIDDTTRIPSSPAPAERAARILAAEAAYREAGGTVLRCPGIYGRDRGLHVRVVRGEHRIPGDGTRFLSRIHVEDLAQLVLACITQASARGETFVVGDLQPARQIDVVRFIAEAYSVVYLIPIKKVHITQKWDK